MNSPLESIRTVYRYLVIGLISLIPLFFLPFTSNFYDTHKWLLMVTLGLVTVIYWALSSFIGKRLTVSFGEGTIGFGALTVAGLVSLIFSSANRVEAAILPTGVLFSAALTVIFFLAGDIFNDDKTRTMLNWTFLVSSGILALIVVYMFFGIGKVMFPTAAFLSDPLWTPTGSALATAVTLAIALPLAIQEMTIKIREKHDVGISVTAIITALVAGALIINLYQLIPKLSSNILPMNIGWSVMLEMYKKFRFLIFGVGAENFMSAFTAARPGTMNLTPLWNIRFTVSASAILHTATTLGIFGLAALILLLIQLVGRKDWKYWGLSVSGIIGILAILLTPPALVIYTVVAILLLLKPQPAERTVSGSIPDRLIFLGPANLVIALILVSGGIYALLRYYAGEVIFFRSLQAAQNNNGTLTYNLQLKAIGYNPNLTSYHVTYSQTNLALANTIASSTASAQLSDQDRQMISQLIQQAIREAKIATTLSPDNVLGWETLARTYGAISGLAQGADDWTIAAYQRAIQLDPTNPILRMNLAGTYLRVQNLDSATRELETAALLKPDMANIHYNLAYIFRQAKNYFREAVELKQTLSLLSAGSDDAEKAKNELNVATDKLTKDELTALNQVGTQGMAQQPLSPIQTEAQPQISPKIELPESASPSSEAVSTGPEEATSAAFPTTLP